MQVDVIGTAREALPDVAVTRTGDCVADVGTQFSCFTGTKAQMLTQKVLQGVRDSATHIRMLTYADVC
jgi:hypothetical protein